MTRNYPDEIRAGEFPSDGIAPTAEKIRIPAGLPVMWGTCGRRTAKVKSIYERCLPSPIQCVAQFCIDKYQHTGIARFKSFLFSYVICNANAKR